MCYWMTIELTRLPQSTIPPIMLVWCIALPLFDMLRVMIKRLHLKKTITAPDQIHFHHILLSEGWSPQFIVFLTIIMTLIFSAIGALALYQPITGPFLFFGFWVIFVLYQQRMQGFK